MERGAVEAMNFFEGRIPTVFVPTLLTLVVIPVLWLLCPRTLRVEGKNLNAKAQREYYEITRC